MTGPIHPVAGEPLGPTRVPRVAAHLGRLLEVRLVETPTTDPGRHITHLRSPSPEEGYQMPAGSRGFLMRRATIVFVIAILILMLVVTIVIDPTAASAGPLTGAVR
jgi:hypothetical protein